MAVLPDDRPSLAEKATSMHVIDLMTIDVLCVTPETTLKDAARMMVEARISGLPVIDAGRHLVGIITEADFLERQADNAQDGRLLAAVFDEGAPNPPTTLVADAMTTEPIVIYPEATIAEAARLMADNGIKRIPVVDAENRVVGIMSRADVVNAFTRPDEIIEDEIRVDLLGRVFAADPEAVDVTVEEGAVTLSGKLEDSSDEALLVELVLRMEGVVGARFIRG